MTDNIISRASGTTFKEISGSEFARTLVPLPPINEQNRIVKKIKILYKVIANLEAATRNLIGFAKCLLAMKQEILRNESSHTHESFNQDAGRGIEPDSTEQ